MHLSGKSYVPILSLRPSEMNALEYLPDLAKDNMTPVILLAPWMNSKTLNQAIERVQRAFPGRSFILDIDRNYEIPSSSDINEAKQKWLDLSRADGDCKIWYDFCNDFMNVVPCLRVNSDIDQQLKNIQTTGREFSVRLTPDIYQSSSKMNVLISSLKQVDIPYSIIIDGEWVANPLLLAESHERVIRNYINQLGDNLIIVSSCTSMLKDFQDISGVKEFPFSNHNLVEQVARATNRKIIYSDWGSTRPREPARPLRQPLPRIDYPTTSNSWLIARDSDWTYKDAAKQIVSSANWDSNLKLWGLSLISATANGEEKGIDNPRTNTAARINIHLYRQSMLGIQNDGFDADAPWID
ncbi:beta family protein [Commensalibacter oyaizuii]|uniref:T4 beta protein n=1 Tax=Commensalibacter oyaizuii TaxID=3043873 RepID=A0ABT6Q3D6_9PROT|nr:hypothetical protein [Commensalibacter sp. TBRC 16381]MDI2091640.1 hypothetical protein [Commensalibacter sp. TBRC 16381]